MIPVGPQGLAQAKVDEKQQTKVGGDQQSKAMLGEESEETDDDTMQEKEQHEAEIEQAKNDMK